MLFIFRKDPEFTRHIMNSQKKCAVLYWCYGKYSYLQLTRKRMRYAMRLEYKDWKMGPSCRVELCFYFKTKLCAICIISSKVVNGLL